MGSKNSEKTTLFQGMQFFMRPCPSKGKLRKLIEDNGGKFVSIMGKNVIRLTDNSSDSQGISADFIIHSVNEGVLKDINKYDQEKKASSSSSSCSKVTVTKSALEKARQSYHPEEDEAIMQYVLSHKSEFGEEGSIGGNALWREMERQKITCHTWQSMKNRYLRHLYHQTPKFSFKPLTIRCYESPLTDDSFSGGSKEDRRAEDQMKSQTIENGKPKKKRMFSQNLTMFSDTPLKPKKKNANDQPSINEAGTSDHTSCDEIEKQEQRTLVPGVSNQAANDNSSTNNNSDNSNVSSSNSKPLHSRVCTPPNTSPSTRSQQSAEQRTGEERNEDRDGVIASRLRTRKSVQSPPTTTNGTDNNKKSSSPSTNVHDRIPRIQNNEGESSSASQQGYSALKRKRKTNDVQKVNFQSEHSINHNGDSLTDNSPEKLQNHRKSLRSPRRKNARLNSGNTFQTPQQEFEEDENEEEEESSQNIQDQITDNDDAVSLMVESQGLFLTQEAKDSEEESMEDVKEGRTAEDAIMIESQSQPVNNKLTIIVIDSQSQFFSEKGAEGLKEREERNRIAEEEEFIPVDFQKVDKDVTSSEEKNSVEILSQPHNDVDEKEGQEENCETVQHSSNSQPISEFSSGKSTDLFQSYTSDEASQSKTKDDPEIRHILEEDGEENNTGNMSKTSHRSKRKKKQTTRSISRNNNNNNNIEHFESPVSNMSLAPKYTSTLMKNTSTDVDDSDDKNCNNENNTKKHQPFPFSGFGSFSDDDNENDEFDKALMRKAVNAKPSIMSQVSDEDMYKRTVERKSYFDHWNPLVESTMQCKCNEKKVNIDLRAGYRQRLSKLLREKYGNLG